MYETIDSAAGNTSEQRSSLRQVCHKPREKDMRSWRIEGHTGLIKAEIGEDLQPEAHGNGGSFEDYRAKL